MMTLDQKAQKEKLESKEHAVILDREDILAQRGRAVQKGSKASKGTADTLVQQVLKVIEDSMDFLGMCKQANH